MIFTEGELAYLATRRLGRLATAKPNGTLQANPVGFEYNALVKQASDRWSRGVSAR